MNLSPTEWLALMQALVKGLHGSSLIGFYTLARMLLIKDEAAFDDFDRAFAEYFQGVEVQAIEDEVMRWLENPIPPYPIDPEMRQLLDSVDVEKLRELFLKRLAEQKERHDGGSRWIGTGGTSPFGHSGYHPGGIRVGGEGRLGSAVQVAAARRYREYRHDIALDTRQLSVAFRKLRALRRDGPAEELDLDDSIRQTARDAGELKLIFRPPRKNNLRLLLAIDVGGSMEPYRRLVDLLFSAVHAARNFRVFCQVYFHNCVYEQVFEDAAFEKPIPLERLLRDFDRGTRLVMVGDAYMYPGELLDKYGAIDWYQRNETPGIVWLERLAAHFRHRAWINPMGRRFWGATSIRLIGKLFPMVELTVDGIEQLAKELR
jgi:uncharacterized protein with von Willebrand factor type A (vWA) domain